MKRTPQAFAIVARGTLAQRVVYDVLINVKANTTHPNDAPHIARIMCNNYQGALLVADALNAGALSLYIEPGSIGE